jgi:hypothetical protein
METTFYACLWDLAIANNNVASLYQNKFTKKYQYNNNDFNRKHFLDGYLLNQMNLNTIMGYSVNSYFIP